MSNKNNIINSWWRSVDQQSIIAYGMLVTFSLILVTTTSASVAEKIGLVDNYFSSRQVIYLLVGACIMIICSALDKKWIKRIGIIGFLLSIILLIIVKFYGYEVKGATRWIKFLGFSYQPSEFAKPFFAIGTGWLLSLKHDEGLPSIRFCLALYLLVAILLLIQPDVGMLILTTAVLTTQMFVAGLPIIWILFTLVSGFLGLISAYFLLPHVTSRINNFLAPVSNENYQVSKSLLAFESGGLYGKGPGEGSVKQYLPDSHTDFIFAVAGEEFGAIICIMIIIVFAFIVLRSLTKINKEKDRFTQFAAIGLIVQFGLQTIINIGVTLNLLPTKGMTLPFISYGGSSTLAIAMAVGMLLGLTKHKTSLHKYKKNHYE
ncbi:MAG: putative lipid II flippase FtsW [Rickettsiaceae bacterium]